MIFLNPIKIFTPVAFIVFSALSGISLAQEVMPEELNDTRANELLSKMTLQEKVRFVHGEGFMSSPIGAGGYIAGIDRLQIPALNSTDSNSGLNISGKEANAYPSPLAMASSWNKHIFYKLGQFTASEARRQGVGELLANTINLGREPRNGRVYENLGEDPVLAGELISERIKGTQSQDVIATVKHFLGNEQETNRYKSDSIIDEKTMRELYLKPFEIAIKTAHPGNVMCGYNKLNGIKSCENKWLLTDLLKNEWGFDGVVQSDWVFAVSDSERAANAGLDEEQPGSEPGKKYRYDEYSQFANHLHGLVDGGVVSNERLNDMVMRKLRIMLRFNIIDNPPKASGELDFAQGHQLSQSIAEESIVLLKNGNPVSAGSAVLPFERGESILVIGGNADKAVLSGGGSSGVAPRGSKVIKCFKPEGYTIGDTGQSKGCANWYSSSPLNEMRQLSTGAKIDYLDGADLNEAVQRAAHYDAVVIFATQFSSEDLDHKNLSLPDEKDDPANQHYDQDSLISNVSKAAKKSVVVLETGGPVLMPWLNDVDAVVSAWYPGEAGGKAIANILYGVVNPSAKLPISFPNDESELPQKVINPQKAVYSEQLAMGYRRYGLNNTTPLFAFGHGMSYTNFSYKSPKVTFSSDSLNVSFELTNVGKLEGAEVPQIYLGLPKDSNQPPKRLVAWDKVSLKPGETKIVNLSVPKSYFDVWNTRTKSWETPKGKYQVYVSSSSMKDELQSEFSL
ncbi:MAG: glycoside hydrolase family 3 C-terminal domain-containing protein [Enterobacter asburiae]|jgi:beta-glucosidase|nr:glycoside hydrolase family 3 C-terminal domain-containing protein [Enterobacter asburiae]